MTILANPTVDVDGEQLPLSEDYFLTQGGSCVRTPMRADGTSTEWPYDVSKMEKCEKPGAHPHIVVRKRPAVAKRRKANAARV